MGLAVMVVGGEPSLIQHTYKKKLAKSGVDVCWHVDRVRQVDSLPPECEGVIVIKDMCTHGLRDSAVQLAKEKGVPFANVLRKFSKAEPILRSVGILKPATSRSPSNTPHQQRVDVATHYIEEERRRGRVPKKDEVEGVVQKAFGPRVKLSNDNYKKAASLAAKAVPFPVEVKENMTTKPKASVEDWCVLLFEDEPSLVLSPARTVAKIEDLFSGDRSHLPTSKCLFDMAEVKAEETRKRWADISASRLRNNPERDYLTELKKKWLRNLFERSQETGIQPLTTEIKEAAKMIFGGSILWDLVREVRGEVTGEVFTPRTKTSKAKKTMPKNLIKAPKAYAFYRSLCDVSNIKHIGEKRFRKLLGVVIEASRQDGRGDHFAPWLTSRQWVRAAFTKHNGDFASLFSGGELMTTNRKSGDGVTGEGAQRIAIQSDVQAILNEIRGENKSVSEAIVTLTNTLDTFMQGVGDRMSQMEIQMTRLEAKLSNRSVDRKTINLTDLLENGVEVNLSKG